LGDEKKDSPLIIRRGYNNTIKKIKTDKRTERVKSTKYKGYFGLIYRSLNKYEGEELYKTLSNWIDMDVYMNGLLLIFSSVMVTIPMKSISLLTRVLINLVSFPGIMMIYFCSPA